MFSTRRTIIRQSDKHWRNRSKTRSINLSTITVFLVLVSCSQGKNNQLWSHDQSVTECTWWSDLWLEFKVVSASMMRRDKRVKNLQRSSASLSRSRFARSIGITSSNTWPTTLPVNHTSSQAACQSASPRILYVCISVHATRYHCFGFTLIYKSWVITQSLTSHLTDNSSFQRQVFLGNHLHWYWPTLNHKTLKQQVLYPWPQ